MRRMIFPVLALLTLPVLPVAAQQLPDTFTIKLTQAEVMLIEKGLMELPYKDSATVLVVITRQVQEQVKPPENPK